NGEKIHYILAEAKNEELATILVLHGNAGNLAGWSNVAEPLTNAGFKVYIIDYRGFGKSDGKASHKHLMEDAITALNYVYKENKDSGKPLMILGFSIGGQLGIALAENNQDKIDLLVVEGTFTTHNDIATAISPLLVKPFARLLVASPYKAIQSIQKLNIPIGIIHSPDDGLIPFEMGQELFEAANEPKKFLQITGDHLAGLELHKEEYISFLKTMVDESTKEH
ncbi:MAG: hypothetical protein C0594_15805, partial [Marinilabiliales bacterium]